MIAQLPTPSNVLDGECPYRLRRFNETAWRVFEESEGLYGWKRGEWWVAGYHCKKTGKRCKSRLMTEAEIAVASVATIADMKVTVKQTVYVDRTYKVIGGTANTPAI